jgi:hypothetical protein
VYFQMNCNISCLLAKMGLLVSTFTEHVCVNNSDKIFSNPSLVPSFVFIHFFKCALPFIFPSIILLFFNVILLDDGAKPRKFAISTCDVTEFASTLHITFGVCV